jgi:hypothetical protein
VAPGVSGASCLYCRAENLIVPQSQLVAVVARKAVSLEYVIAEEARQRRKVRAGFAGAVGIAALAGMVMLLVMWFVLGATPSGGEGSLHCSHAVCSEWRSQRLERGEKLAVELKGTAAGPPKLRLEGQEITPFPRSWVTVDQAKIDDDGLATLVAPWDGAFRVVVEVPGPADAELFIPPSTLTGSRRSVGGDRR